MAESVALSKDKTSSKARDCSVVSDTGEVRWHAIMRKFSESSKEHCKSVTVEMPRVERSLKTFPTGSQYEGTWDVLGISGYGNYVFPHGVVYEGDFEDGMFHGEGELRYESGATLRGQFKKGIMTERTLIFSDDLEYDEKDFKYCQYPDRRYTEEYEDGIQPAGISYITYQRPPIEIPLGFYDTGTGFFDPITKVIYKYNDLTAIQRAPSLREQKWILDNCRKNPDEPIGPSPHLYEEWSEPLVEPERTPLPAATIRGFQGDLLDNESGVLGRCPSDRFGFWRYSGGRKSNDRFSIKFGPELPSSNEISRSMDRTSTDLKQRSKQRSTSADPRERSSDVHSRALIAGTGERPSKADQRSLKADRGSTAERPSKIDQIQSKTDRGSTVKRPAKVDQRQSKTDRDSKSERPSKIVQKPSMIDRGSTGEAIEGRPKTFKDSVH